MFSFRSCMTMLLFASSSFFIAEPSAAEERLRVPVAAEKKIFTPQESKAIGDAVQKRDEARQKVWDRKMEAVSKSVCVGC
jgi:hypothetical protein